MFYERHPEPLQQSESLRSKSNANFCLVDGFLSLPFSQSPALFLSFYCVSFITMKKGWKITHHGSNDPTALSVAVVDNYHLTRVKVVSIN